MNARRAVSLYVCLRTFVILGRVSDSKGLDKTNEQTLLRISGGKRSKGDIFAFR